MSGPNFNKNSGKGRLATDRYDFEDHAGGVSRRHKDNQIDLLDPLTELPADNVHEALEALNDKINASGLVTIGEGFSIYDSDGAFLDASDAGPALDSELIDVFTNTSGVRYKRLRDGGILLIKSGTYKITSTIDVPPGITIMGEGFGTKLINRIVANGGSEAPMFRFKSDVDHAEDRSIVSGDTTYDPFLTTKACRLLYILIADNYVKPISFGDTSYRDANNTTEPLVYLENGAGLECESVVFLGRSELSDPSLTTHSAIGIDPLSGSSDATYLSVKNCKIDGFNRAVTYTTANGTKDYLEFKNNHVRIFGPVAGVSNIANSNVIFTNDCNLDVIDNYIWTDTQLLGIVYFDAFVSGSIPVRAKSNVSVSHNTIANTKYDNSVTTPDQIVEVTYKASIASDAINKLNVFAIGNLFDTVSGYKVRLNQSGPRFLMTDTDIELNSAGGITTITGASSNIICNNGGVTIVTQGVSPGIMQLVSGSHVNMAGEQIFVTANDQIVLQCLGTNQTIKLDAGQYVRVDTITSNLVVTYQYIIFVDSTSGARTVTLPVPDEGRVIIIKDSGGAASTNNITLARNNGSNKIEGLASNFIIQSNYAKIKLVADGTDWWFV